MSNSKRALHIVIKNLLEVQCFNFARRSFALPSLAFGMLILDDHVRDSSNIRPKYFTCFEIYICWSLILKFSFFVTSFPFGRNMIISVLSTLSDIPLALKLVSYYWLALNRDLYMFIFFIELVEYKRFMSSAKWCISECWITLFISFIYIRNRSGPLPS